MTPKDIKLDIELGHWRIELSSFANQDTGTQFKLISHKLIDLSMYPYPLGDLSIEFKRALIQEMKRYVDLYNDQFELVIETVTETSNIVYLKPKEVDQ